jgi:hypothetical protein
MMQGKGGERDELNNFDAEKKFRQCAVSRKLGSFSSLSHAFYIFAAKGRISFIEHKKLDKACCV